ncbi:hypothetical protein BGX27_005150 [Mortierella sp. AM989]|nr:hypothetical protein BGX27_005150 [Mortierella sp. AM989]
MPPRPARSAKKNVSYKLDDLNTEKRKGKDKAKTDQEGETDDDMEEVNQDEDDSDEYVEPTKGKDDGDYDEDMDIPEDEDDEDIEDVNDEDNNDEDGDEDSYSKSVPTKKRRQRLLKSFSVSLDQMSELLTIRNDAHATPTGVPGERMKITPATIPHKMAPVTATQRAPRDQKGINKMHKKGDMRRADFLPLSWKLSYQAPAFEDIDHVSMQEDVLRTVVYPNIKSNVKDFRVVTEPPDLDEYLPVLATTKITTRDSELEMGSMTARYIETTDKAGINDFYMLNTGFSVWSIDWCPLPSYEEDELGENMNYIAVGGFPDTAENCIARDQLYPLGKQDAHPNVIQLWNMNCASDDEGQLKGEARAYLAICILHTYGAVLDLQWCPTGCYMPAESATGDLARLGILAASFTDGTIRIFSIPDPVSLQSHLGLKPIDGSTPETIYIQYPEPYVTIRLGDVNFMSISWGTANRLAAGVTNGTVAIWDTSAMLNQSKETLAEKDSEYLDPIYLPQVHDVCVRSIDWLRNEDPTSIPWIIATSGYDGHVRYTDLRDSFQQIDIKTILGAPMTSRCIPWADATVYIDIDLAAKLDQLYLECRGFRLFNAKGTIWDISYSDYQPYLAAAISDGHVKLTNPAYKARRGYGMVQNFLYQIQDVSTEQTPSADVEGGELSTTQDEAMDLEHPQDEIGIVKSQAFRYVEGEEKEYTSKSDGSMRFYGANIAVQKVQWSRSFHSAAWLASGTAGGMVRVDNTMLRTDEGGTGNKIKYQLEPHILKKRLARGGAYDEEGRRIGADGEPVKIGRPRKPEAETTRGKKKAAAIARGKAKASPAKKKAATPKSKSHKSAAESEVEDEEGGDAHVEGSSSTMEKRTTRQSVKLAPIFTRTLSSAASSRATSPSIDEEEEFVVEEEDGDDDEQLAESSASRRGQSSAKSPKPTPPSKKPAAPKPKGRPKKAASKVTELPKDAEGDVEMADVSSETVAGREDQTMEELEPESAHVVSTAVNGKGKAKATTTSTLAKEDVRPIKNCRKSSVSKDKQAQMSEVISATESMAMDHDGGDASASTNTAAIQGVQEEVEPVSVSVAPNSPRKKRGSQTSKKRAEELKRTNHSLKDLWGAAAANKSTAADKSAAAKSSK